MNPSAAQNIRIQQWVLGIAMLLFLIKMIAWYLTGSLAILTDGLESTVNVVSGMFGLYSLYLSAKPRDADHPYGHGKIEFISAGIEGSLIVAAGGLILYESIQHLFNPRPIEQVTEGLALILTTAAINFGVGWIAIRQGIRSKSIALESSGRHLQTDTWSTLGICAGLLVYHVTHALWLDPLIAILLAGVIIFNGLSIVRKSVAGIMDESDLALLTEMVAYLQKHRRLAWVDLHNLRVVKYGSVLHIDCHVTVPWYWNVHQAHAEITALDQLIKEKYGESIEMFVHADGCMEFSCHICRMQDCPQRKHPFEHSIAWTVENISNNRKHGERP